MAFIHKNLKQYLWYGIENIYYLGSNKYIANYKNKVLACFQTRPICIYYFIYLNFDYRWTDAEMLYWESVLLKNKIGIYFISFILFYFSWTKPSARCPALLYRESVPTKNKLVMRKAKDTTVMSVSNGFHVLTLIFFFKDELG